MAQSMTRRQELWSSFAWISCFACFWFTDLVMWAFHWTMASEDLSMSYKKSSCYSWLWKQIFAILDNLVHLLQTQSNVVTLRAAKRMLVCSMFLEIWMLWIAETQLTAVVGALTFIILAVTLVFRFEVPLTVAKRSSRLIGYVLLQAYLIKLIYYSVDSLESHWTIGCYVGQATKWLLLRGFPYLKNSK